MSAGKQIHPFFSYWNSGNKNGEVTDVEGSRFLVGKKITCGPIHVYERIRVSFFRVSFNRLRMDGQCIGSY